MKLIIILAAGLVAFHSISTVQPVQHVIIQDTELTQDLIRRIDLLSKIFNTNMRDYTEFSTQVTITAYSATKAECDATPWVTSSGELSRVGILAASRDLLLEFGLELGDQVLLFITNGIGVTHCIGLFTIADKMSTHKHKGSKNIEKITKTVDLLMANPEAAKRWGVKQGSITWVRGY